MYEITDEVYRKMAEELVAKIGPKEFFSGSISVISGDTECRLVATLIVTHGRNEAYAGRRAITSIVPVWWECHTLVGECEMLNDFSFATMLEQLF